MKNRFLWHSIFFTIGKSVELMWMSAELQFCQFHKAKYS